MNADESEAFASIGRECAPRSIARVRAMKPPQSCRREWPTNCSAGSIPLNSRLESCWISEPAPAAWTSALKQRYRRALVVALDLAPGMLREARRQPTSVPPVRTSLRGRDAAAVRGRERGLDRQQPDVAVVRSTGSRLRRSPPGAEARRLFAFSTSARTRSRSCAALGRGGRIQPRQPLHRYARCR